ncbi:MAG: cation:proton antiporter [Bacteroidia bacterium]|nr:cation:proton antiporter [Bacteroidia bacterium]
MDILSSYNLIIESSIILILSFFFSEISRKTNVPSVIMLILLGMLCQIPLNALGVDTSGLFPILELLGIIGLIMIVLEAALELKLDKKKIIPITKALVIALVGLLASAWVAARVLMYYYPEMSTISAWLYATPFSILSSAIIIPSVSGFRESKKEFHVYESTFSDILGIIMFYFLTAQSETQSLSSGLLNYSGTVLLTIVISFIASYIIVFVFQNIRSHTKLFLLIAVLMLLYSLGKLMHLSSLIMILVFGLVISNIKLFFRGWLAHWLDMKKTKEIFDGLHVITIESAFVVRTFFFVVFGLTIAVESIWNLDVVIVSLLIIASIYLIRLVLLGAFIGRDINPQLYIAPRGLITILLYYAIPVEYKFSGFNEGILLFIIMFTSLIMTGAMVADKRKTGKAIKEAKSSPVGVQKWKAPSVDDF